MIELIGSNLISYSLQIYKEKVSFFGKITIFKLCCVVNYFDTGKITKEWLLTYSICFWFETAAILYEKI